MDINLGANVESMTITEETRENLAFGDIGCHKVIRINIVTCKEDLNIICFPQEENFEIERVTK